MLNTHVRVVPAYTGFSASHTPHTPHKFRPVCDLCFALLSIRDFMLASVRDANATAAARRRQRRLRSWLRHERMTVAMTLAEMAHHTAPRGPKMARVGEEVVQDAHEALRGQKTPPPGKRPAALRESGPQLVAEHAGCPCSCLPSLATPVSGGCDGRRGGLLLPPFPRGLCVGGQKEGGGEGGAGEAGEEHRGEGAVARCAACSPDAGAEAQDRRDLRRVSGLSLPPAGEEEEEEEEEEKASSVYSSSNKIQQYLRLLVFQL